MLAQKVQEKVPSHEKLMLHLQKQWISWMGTPDSGFSGMLPLYCKIFLDGDPSLLDKTPVPIVPSYKSHLSMWRHESLLNCFPNAIKFMRASGCGLGELRSIEIIQDMLEDMSSYVSCHVIFDALKPETICPEGLNEILGSYVAEKSFKISDSLIELALRMPGHEIWKDQRVWESVLSRKFMRGALHLSQSLSPEDFRSYCVFGEAYIQKNNPEFMDAWKESLNARIAQENASDLNATTPLVSTASRQSRL